MKRGFGGNRALKPGYRISCYNGGGDNRIKNATIIQILSQPNESGQLIFTDKDGWNGFRLRPDCSRTNHLQVTHPYKGVSTKLSDLILTPGEAPAPPPLKTTL